MKTLGRLFCLSALLSYAAFGQVNPTVFIIVMENHNWSSIQGSSSAPYINNTLLPQASYALNYKNVPGLHPSLPNYLWLEAGTNFGITADGDPSTYRQSTTSHLVTQLTTVGITWKSYQEDISGTTCPLIAEGGTSGYAPKHNPMVYFDDVTNNNNASSATCIAHVRPYSELATDLTNNTVPSYVFITPNLCNDMHNSTGCVSTDSVANGDTWLSNAVPMIMSSAAYRNGGAVFITWDESEGGDVPIGMIVLAPHAKGGGYTNNIYYTHGSTLRSFEEIFGVPLIGDALNQTDLSDLFTSFPLNGFGIDFSISSSPTSLTLVQGAGGTSTISTAVAPGTSGTSETVSLSVSGAPSGVTASLIPTSVSSGGSSTLSISTTTAAVAGTYTLTVTGTAASGSHATTVSLTIAAVNDFSITASPASVSVTAGNSTSSTISTAVTSGSSETVSLSVSGAPSGVTAILSPASVSSGGSTNLSIGTTTSAAAGTYTLTVTGTAPSGSHATTVSLTIAAVNDFSISASPASVSVTAGNSTSSTIATAVTSGTSETLSLSVSGAPSGVTPSLSPASVSSGGSSTLSISTTTATAAGTYTLTVTGTATSGSHSTAVSLTVSGSTGSGITNGGFETGDLSGWTASGASETVINSGCHSGTYCAQLGSTSPTNGDSTIKQTFTAPAGAIGVSLWFEMSCLGTVTNEWVVVKLKDNTAGTTATLLPKICTTNSWTNIAGNLTAGHSYTLTLTSHDDNAPSDPTYTVFDDVTIMNSAPPPVGIVNGGFETGDLGGWNVSGVSETVISSGCHSGTYCVQLGSTGPTNGNSTIAQTFTAPAGAAGISLWYKGTCPDKVNAAWAVVKLKDNTTGVTTNLLPRTCTTNSWTNITGTVTAGHDYTLTLRSHDDNDPVDATYTLYDDVTLN